MSKKKAVLIRIDEEVHHEFKRVSSKLDVPMGTMVDVFIRDFLRLNTKEQQAALACLREEALREEVEAMRQELTEKAQLLEDIQSRSLWKKRESDLGAELRRLRDKSLRERALA